MTPMRPLRSQRMPQPPYWAIACTSMTSAETMWSSGTETHGTPIALRTRTPRASTRTVQVKFVSTSSIRRTGTNATGHDCPLHEITDRVVAARPAR